MGTNHRLLDTAYVMKFTIEADQTTIPEVEYVKEKFYVLTTMELVADDEKNTSTSHSILAKEIQ